MTGIQSPLIPKKNLTSVSVSIFSLMVFTTYCVRPGGNAGSLIPPEPPRQWSRHSGREHARFYTTYDLHQKFCLCPVCPPHMTSAPSPGKLNRFPCQGRLKHYLILYLNLKTANCFASSAATSNFAVQPHYCSYRQFGEALLSEVKIIWSVLQCLPSHRLDCMKPFRLASASTVLISSPITSFLSSLPIQQHHYWKLRLYSTSFENMSSLSLTSIPSLFE